MISPRPSGPFHAGITRNGRPGFLARRSLRSLKRGTPYEYGILTKGDFYFLRSPRLMTLPNLAILGSDEKDVLILTLFEKVQSLEAVVVQQQTIITALQGKLAADSHNSNKPPSTNGFRTPPQKPKSLRQKTGKKSGGQPGNPGKTLIRVEHPDHVVVHAPPITCDACQASLSEEHTVKETRQVFDLPEIRYKVTEHRILQKTCSCGKLHCGVFPSDVSAPVQYGPKVLAAAVYLSNQQMIPLQRTAEAIDDLFGLPISEATVLTACTDAEECLQPTVDAIAESFQTVPVAHADETGLKIGKSLHWMHLMVTAWVTWIGCHKKRGAEAMIAIEILPKFSGILVHDGWESYRRFSCLHALCNAHHLRELTYLFEEMKQTWAGRMIDLLREACHEVNEAVDGIISEERRASYRARYDEILCAGERDHPHVPSSGKRGRTKQSKATNLLGRLRRYADDVWRFASDPNVPFTNNLAEQAVRMPKVKQKVSGCFRTERGAKRFCVIRSYLATMHKQGVNLFGALTSAFEGNVQQPRFQ